MATLFANGWDVPNEYLAHVARLHGIVQGEGNGIDPSETQAEAITRLEDTILALEHRNVKMMLKRETAAAATDPNTYITKN
jgi:hypothetical protein